MTYLERPVTGSTLLAVAVSAGMATIWVGDPLAGASVAVLWAIWWILPTADGPPILGLAMSYHLCQAVIGIFYYGVTGRQSLTIAMSDYRPMVWIYLGCVMAMSLGIRVGHELVKRRRSEMADEAALSWQNLITFYVIALVLRTAIQEFAWANMTFNQAVLAFGYLRLGLFYIILRRLIRHRQYTWACGLAAVEIVLGLTGYFAEFREPLLITLLVLIEYFDRRRAAHWAIASGIAVASLFLGLMWMGIRGDIRERSDNQEIGATTSQRLEVVRALGSQWYSRSASDTMEQLDSLVNRLWDVYYPAVAVSRVPSVLPHENGAIMWRAIQHVVAPRILYPDKPELENDSLAVRKYTGINVAGPEQNTSIAFGYAVESYIDFGIPLMFLPIFLFGILMGVGFRLLSALIVHRELAVAAVTVVFWLSVSPFNRGWARLLGIWGTLVIYVGGTALLVDKYLKMGGWGPAVPDSSDDDSEPVALPTR